MGDALNKFACGVPGLALGYVRWNGNYRTPYLGHQPELFFGGESAGKQIGLFRQLHAFLPDM
jgi:hypothetical protein